MKPEKHKSEETLGIIY